MDLPNKELVGKRFFKKKDTYKKQAIIQKQVSEKLTDILLSYTKNISQILEVGSGVGFLTDCVLSKFDVNQYYANDITPLLKDELSSVFQKHSYTNYEFLMGDAETISFPDTLQAITSSSTFQWFHDIPSFFVKSHDALEKNGYLAFSSYGPLNFIEIKKINNHGLRYLTLAQLKALLKPYFTIEYATEWTEKIYFPTSYDVLKHIQATGVNSVTVNRHYFGKNNIDKFTRTYSQRFTENNQVYLTYHPIIIIAKKK
ncbi:MAG: methyltransferase domain-containing protein [Bacteroidales bacterium]